MNLKGKILQLYTTEYPYGKTESFLENEVPVLAKKFEKIYIHPLLSKKGEPRELPDNVEVGVDLLKPLSIKTSRCG